MKHLYIIHENKEWLTDFETYLKNQQIKYTLWFVDDGLDKKSIDFSREPPDGIFYNRASCSSHTRGHVYSNVYVRQILYWLTLHKRSIINGLSAFDMETSKTLQYMALLNEGIQTPKTMTATSRDNILSNAIVFPIMLKDNQGGSGSGVYMIHSREALEKHLEDNNYPISPDSLTLIQDRKESSEKKIYRVEIVNAEHLYTLAVDTTSGYNLCPATTCQMENCPIRGSSKGEKFKIIQDPRIELIEKYKSFSKKYHLDIVAFEYIVDQDGECWTYDINCNTNYNRPAEVKAGKPDLSYQKIINFLKLK